MDRLSDLFIIGMFFILEVLCMLIFVGAYFTCDFTGVYFFSFLLLAFVGAP